MKSATLFSLFTLNTLNIYKLFHYSRISILLLTENVVYIFIIIIFVHLAKNKCFLKSRNIIQYLKNTCPESSENKSKHYE